MCFPAATRSPVLLTEDLYSIRPTVDYVESGPTEFPHCDSKLSTADQEPIFSIQPPVDYVETGPQNASHDTSPDPVDVLHFETSCCSCKTFSIDQRRTCGINKRTVQPVLTDEDLAYITNAGSRWPIEILNLPGRQRQLRDRRRSQCQSGFCYLPTTTPHYIPPASILPPTPSQFGHTYQLCKWLEVTTELIFG